MPAASLLERRWPSSPLPSRSAPGHFAFELMSGLRAAANRPEHPLRDEDVVPALQDAEAFEIDIEATPWSDVHRAWQLAQAPLRYADAIYVAAAERQHSALLTADARIDRSGAPVRCRIITIAPVPSSRGRDAHGAPVRRPDH